VKPTPVKLAVAMAVVAAVLGAVSVALILQHAGHNALVYHRRHPTTSLGVSRGAQYTAAGLIGVSACLYAVSAQALWRGKRWAWVLLVVVASVGVFGLLLGLFVRSRSVFGWITAAPTTIVLFGCLLARSTREYVDREAATRAMR
jgi:uncharacterized membrane protein